MIVSFSVCQRDEANALATLEWAYVLDGLLPYRAIVSLAAGVDAARITAAAQKLFRAVTVLPSEAPEAWPQGKNATFQNLVRWLDLQHNTEPFFWWEPDAIPLKRNWLAMIEAAHKAGGQPFSGYIYDALGSMDCVGVYPPDFMSYSPLNGMLCRAAPWDACAKLEVFPHVHRINHLLQFVNDVDGFPPTFGDDLSLLRPDVVLFHKSKDGSLVQQLSKGKVERFMGKMFGIANRQEPKANREKITVVFPVCAKDIDQAIHHAKWLGKMKGCSNHKAIIAHDGECPVTKAQDLYGLLEGAFQSVARFVYPTPQEKSYPAAANWAFARVAEYMGHGSAPWLWLESDCVVLKANWLDTLQREYDDAGQPFMGPVVKERGYGHVNGSCV